MGYHAPFLTLDDIAAMDRIEVVNAVAWLETLVKHILPLLPVVRRHVILGEVLLSVYNTVDDVQDELLTEDGIVINIEL